ncbi:MAG: ABC-F family ATP-binding cassette domain-containing protein [Chloroflexi bacterium]|nr:ABC-F family ATP-binding cassette domain-containing protein [Chloroflexota bacterium]
MNFVTLENVGKQYSERVLLENANLLINDGDRIGLIGPNGSGKTTLLRLIAGVEAPDAGQITVWGHVGVQFLPQDPQLDPSLTVLETVFHSDAPLMRVLRDYEAANERLQGNPTDAGLQAAFAEATAVMDRSNGWAAEAEAKTILTKLGVTQFAAPVATLSGGQHKRVALAHALITPADLLILDEPTNHIDAEAIAWLEEYLKNRPGALLMVTHDRYFLDRVVNRILDLDRRQLVSYGGNYGRYLELATVRHEQLAATEKKRQALLRRELDWLSRSPAARSTKQKARIQRVQEMQTLRHDRREAQVAISLAGRRLGKRVLEARGLSKAFGSLALFAGLDFELVPGDRVGVLGPNGAGKSTLLNILAGKLPPDSGTVTWGETVELGYYDQLSAGLRDDQRVFDTIADAAPLVKNAEGFRIDAAQMLEWFLFSRADQQTYVGSLSGGERRRLYLLLTLVRQPNVLFLDEPTNDLDIETLAVLEQFLDYFQGCLVVVSHDRYFLDRNVDFLASFEDGVLGTRYPTPYETYRRLLNEQRGTTSEERPVRSGPPPAARHAPPVVRKLTWKEKQELTAVETQIPLLEAQIAQLEAAINQVGGDYARLQTLSDELTAVRAALEIAETRWLELSETGR